MGEYDKIDTATLRKEASVMELARRIRQSRPDINLRLLHGANIGFGVRPRPPKVR